LNPEIVVSPFSLENFATKKLELIGYSGGAAIANYLAMRLDNIESIRTVAGNLDHKKFCEIHSVPYLERSKPPIKDFKKLEKIPQIHFVGEKDKIVPIDIAQEFVAKFQNKKCAQIIVVKNATHQEKWLIDWKNIIDFLPECL
jgi:predicted esterase